MLDVTSGVQIVAGERNAAVKAEIRETLSTMESGQSFEIIGKIKRGTTAKIAKEMEVKVKFGKDAEGKTWCTKQ